VKHKIYFIDRLQELLRRGHDLTSAVRHAGVDRMRPVIFTALTTILGLLPLELDGGPFWASYSWVNIFGLLAAIPLSLVPIPAMVSAAFRMRDRLTRRAPPQAPLDPLRLPPGSIPAQPLTGAGRSRCPHEVRSARGGRKAVSGVGAKSRGNKDFPLGPGGPLTLQCGRNRAMDAAEL
jgi:AcrB/AcrD/AcrF family